MEYQDELESAIQWTKERMPVEIKNLISLASYDLWHGPIWLDAEGEACSGCDEGAIEPFDFSKACEAIASWFSANVPDLEIEVEYNEETEESYYETCEGSAGMIRKAICGRLDEYL